MNSIDKVRQDAVYFATQIAKDNRHGYSQAVRSLYEIDMSKAKSFDCSSLVLTSYYYALLKNGYKKEAAYIREHCDYTGNMEYLQNAGFEIVARNQTGYSNAVAGDIELNVNDHTAMYIGSGQICHARSSEGTTDTIDGSGNEIRTQPWYQYSRGWDVRLRFTGSGAKRTEPEQKTVEMCNVSITLPELEIGMVGTAVKLLQTLLGVESDGEFGNLTNTALVNFQKLTFPSKPSEWDGVAGSRTWTELFKKIE